MHGPLSTPSGMVGHCMHAVEQHFESFMLCELDTSNGADSLFNDFLIFNYNQLSIIRRVFGLATLRGRRTTG